VREGQAITVHYDPLLAKLIVHAASRDEAIRRTSAALAEFEILGVHHNIAFLRALLDRPEVRASAIDIHFIEEHLAELAGDPPETVRTAAAAIAAAVAAREPRAEGALDLESGARDPWQTLGPILW
jgi:acetyl/propionyl-CoA carboxylase alpha subunit